MSDTRCADPTLQIDVDVMVLEYLLYQATRAQFQALESLSIGKRNTTPQPQPDDKLVKDEAAAQRLLDGFQRRSCPVRDLSLHQSQSNVLIVF